MKNVCPVCGYSKLAEPPYDSNNIASSEICPSCGFEFGYDDFDLGETFESYRKKWVEKGANWFDNSKKPINWKLQDQLDNIKE